MKNDLHRRKTNLGEVVHEAFCTRLSSLQGSMHSRNNITESYDRVLNWSTIFISYLSPSVSESYKSTFYLHGSPNLGNSHT